MGSQPPTNLLNADSIGHLVQQDIAQVVGEPEIEESQFVEQISAENKRNAERRKSTELTKSRNLQNNSNDCSPLTSDLQQTHSSTILKEAHQKVNKKNELPPLKSTRKYVGDIIFFQENDQILQAKKQKTEKTKKSNENTQTIIFEDMEEEDDQTNREQNIRGYLHHRSKKFRPQKIHI